MKTAADFDLFYAAPDPWHISHAAFRDRVLRRSIRPFVTGKSVLELGCGEGHLTRSVLDSAKSVTGIDFSTVAIERARRFVPSARFAVADLLDFSFTGYDVITAIECIYYLSASDREAFFAKVAREHSGKPLILSTPIIGTNAYRKYFTHPEIVDLLSRHGMKVTTFRNLNVYRQMPVANHFLSNLAAAAVRIPFGDLLLDMLPERLIYQRCYIAR